MRRFLILALALAALAAVLPTAAMTAFAANCPDVAPPALAFDEPTFIDRTRAGGEPVSIVAQDGSINVSTHAGTTHVYKDPAAAGGAGDFAVDYTNQTLNWRSDDGGKSWEYVGIPLVKRGPHSATSTGFSDPDYAMDAGGRIYNTEIDLANVAVFSSLDDGQSYTVANPIAASGDRPWLTAGDKDEVFLYVNLPRQLFRSTNGGVTFDLINVTTATGNRMDPNFPVKAKIYNDPKNFEKGLIGPAGTDAIAISNNDGRPGSWKIYEGAGLGPNVDFFGAIAVDKAGNAYRAAAGGYGGPSDTTADGQVTFNYFDRSTESWGEQAVIIPTPKGDAMWPWVIAGDDGRAAVVWYQNLEGKPNEFYAYAAYTTNAHGTTVTCDDGSTKFIPPQFSVANASGRPVHVGAICLQGTACNASTNFVNGDRRLGDFFTVNYDKDGALFIVSGDTTLRSPTGGPKPVGNPIFIKQSSGAPMLEQPMPVRKTRCLFPLPSC
ncbi:MAG: hypothetical protein M3O86_06445 [Actinomycetota bacterium]|nr:hypothetical protein [Actinomycetota bacterium]